RPPRTSPAPTGNGATGRCSPEARRRQGERVRSVGPGRRVRTAGGAKPPGPIGQVAALVALRRAALRGPARRRAVVGAALLPGLAVAAVITGTLYPRRRVPAPVPLAPTAWLFSLVGRV